jgi:hypothetical protein
MLIYFSIYSYCINAALFWNVRNYNFKILRFVIVVQSVINYNDRIYGFVSSMVFDFHLISKVWNFSFNLYRTFS